MNKTQENTKKQSYLPKLDGLRAISIFLVLAEHFLWTGHGLGSTGVIIFFVISGYLITSILIQYADSMSTMEAAVKFYWRRTLRLFPVYYLSIGVAAAFGIGNIREEWWISALYLKNFQIAFDGVWGSFGHFWSLAVEEQFYILWFLVVFLLPRRFLLGSIAFFIITAPLYRAIMCVTGVNALSNVLLPGSMDSLASGALIAYIQNTPTMPPLWHKFIKIRGPALLASFCLMIVVIFIADEPIRRILAICITNIFAVCLVTLAIEPLENKSHWLAGKTIRHFGKISYGIYVYHCFVPPIIDSKWTFAWFHSYTITRFIRFSVLVAVSIGIAEISWYVLEKPIMKLKDKTLFKPSQHTEISEVV